MVSAAKTRKMLADAIGDNHERNRGLLVDMSGHFTLGELYLDNLLDLGFKSDEIISILASNELSSDATQSLSEIISLMDIGIGRGILTHKAWPPLYKSFYSQINNATNIKSENFPKFIESAGEDLNKELPNPDKPEPKRFAIN